MQNILKNKKTVFCIILFVVLLVLSFMFPYSGDDWAWGSQLGIDRFNNFFDNYNGRYAGNLLVLVLTRSKIIDAIVTAVSLFAVCLLPSKLSGSKRFGAVLASTVMFFIMPKEMFAQACVWTSGFSNYVPPIIIAVIYFDLIKNIFNSEKPVYKPILSPIFVIIAFVGSLFMENITLFYIAMSAIIILYTILKFKKVYIANLSFMLGSIVGAAVMFSNGAYAVISAGSDSYRTVANSFLDLIKTISSNLNVIIDNNIIGWRICSLMCAFAVITYIINGTNKKFNKTLIAMMFFNVLSLVMINMKSKLNVSDLKSTVLFVIFALIYYVSIFAIVAVVVNDKTKRDRMIFISSGTIVILAPLLVVNPIGPRCIFPAYFLEMVFCIDLYSYSASKIKSADKIKKATKGLFGIVAVALFAFYLSIYGSIFYYDNKRDEYIENQLADNQSVITICELPHSSYVWYGNPKKEIWVNRFKSFHGIDENTELKVLKPDEFKVWAENYD